MTEIISNILEYIVNIKLLDIPREILYIGVSGVIGYSVSLILIGFPCSIYEKISKKKINDNKQNRIICILAICLSVVFFYNAFIK